VTGGSEPDVFGGFSTTPSTQVPWWWQQYDAEGIALVPDGGRHEFPTRSDAESWLGEVWSELAEQGVASVSLFEGDRQVYGPMSLSA
jgi:hypothetical protein